jgi:sortase (surface protein transpeptidase)
MIVKPTSVWILNQTSDRTLTIFTCHPRGTTRQRYVVVARLST